MINNNSGPRIVANLDYFSNLGDTTLSLQILGQASRIQISPRQNDRVLGSVKISKEFPSAGLLSGEAGYLRSKVEDYLNQDIQSILSDTIFGRARFRYKLAKQILFLSENQIQTPNRAFIYRNIESGIESRNVRYFQDEYQSQNTIQYLGNRLRLNFAFETKTRNRTYDIINRLEENSPDYNQNLIFFNQRLKEERIKDITEQYTTYTTEGRWKLNKNHAFRFNYVAQLLRVDTRSELNNQDRDEILYAGEFGHEWGLFQNFKLINKWSSSLRHLIFIEASQSSENFKDRIIRWEPGFRWSTAKLKWSGQMGIWATYQVRDFESQQEKNRSNRVLIIAHQADYKLNNHLNILADVLRRENRLSQLNWKRFSESPIDTVTIYDLSLKTQYSVNDGENEKAFQLGYRAYWQVRKAKASLTDPAVGSRLIFLKTIIIQQGPQIKATLSKTDRFRIMAEFWLQWSLQYFNYSRSEDTFLGNSYSPDQLAVRDSRFLPFFTIQGTWLLKK